MRGPIKIKECQAGGVVKGMYPGAGAGSRLRPPAARVGPGNGVKVTRPS